MGFGAGIGVRLEYRNDSLSLCHILCRRYRRGKLCRVVGVIRIDKGSARSALIFKPAQRTGKIRYTCADFFVRNIAKVAHGKRRKRIIYIMVAGDAQAYLAARAGAGIYIKGIKPFFICYFLCRIIAFCVVYAERDRIGQVGRDFFRNRVVPADDSRRHFCVGGKRQVSEFVKRRPYTVDTGKIVRVVDIYIEYDGNRRKH